MLIAENVTIVGCGLLGASLGLALKERGLARRITGVGRNASTLEQAVALGAIDATSLDARDPIPSSDLVVLATPVGKCIELLGEIAPLVSDQCIITDVGSTKGAICDRAATLWPHRRRFVGSHPMAGSEKSGPQHARADLYTGAVCLVEEHPGIEIEASDRIVRLWEAVGARVARVESRRHDVLLAFTSHLPHVAASNLAIQVGKQGSVRDFVGNGYRDTTRIAASRPEVWTEICMTNRDALLQALAAFEHSLGDFRSALESGDTEAIERFFAAGQAARNEVCTP